MANYFATDTDLTAVANAIRAKTGTSEQLEFPSEFVSAIGAISGGEAEKKDVNYIDYDGTILHSYTAQEYASLTEHPDNPSHSGLTAQGWNWSLADAKSYVASYGKLWIGQMYITDDEKTRIYFSASENTLSPYIGFAVNGSATVDWGDNSATDTMTGSDTTTLVQQQHTYAAAGDYVITILPSSGSQIAFIGDYNIYQRLINKLPNGTFPHTYSHELCYGSRVTKLEIGRGVILSAYSLQFLSGVKTITIPKECGSAGYGAAIGNNYDLVALVTPMVDSGTFDVAGCYYCQCCHRVSLSSNTKVNTCSFGYAGVEEVTFPPCGTSTYSFESNYQIKEIIIPDGITSIAQNFANKTWALKKVRLPNGITELPQNAFNTATALSELTIPSGVTKLNSTALGYCYSLTELELPDTVINIQYNAMNSLFGLKKLRFRRTTPASVASANAFSSLPTDCVIYVPSSALETYKTATNYPDPNTYTYVGE